MMLLLSLTPADSTAWRPILQDIYQITQILGVILVAVYVIYTYKTFQQIKKQAEFQQDAYLKIEQVLYPTINNESQKKSPTSSSEFMRDYPITEYIDDSIANKYKSIFKPAFKQLGDT